MVETISKVFSSLPLPDLRDFKVIAEPEGEREGFWVGGCSSLKDKKGKIWLAYRMRDPERRGHALHIVSSSDGINFEKVCELKKEDFNCVSLERAALLQDPVTEKYKLYVSLEKEGKWFIYKLKDVLSPKEFDPLTAYPVFLPSYKREDSRKVKDPYIINFLNRWWMFYSGSGKEPQEELYLATSEDGEIWEYKGRILQRKFWHNHHTRISCIFPTDKGFVIFYEGSSSSWYEPHFNLNIGFAYTQDMQNFFDLTTKKPLLSSPTRGKFCTIRYMDYVLLDKKIIFYYEAAREDGAFELRASWYEK